VSLSTGLRLLDTSAPGSNLLSGAFVLRGYNHAGSFDGYSNSPSGHRVLLPCFQHRPGTPQRKGRTCPHVLLLDAGQGCWAGSPGEVSDNRYLT
jgi:hypothetical protein